MDALTELAARRIKHGSKSFAAAAALLPQGKRESIHLLYSWCRHCDDLIDDEYLGFQAPPSGIGPAEKLERLRDGTMAALRGAALTPEFGALQRVVSAHAIPERYPLELIDGMAMDALGTEFRTVDDTLRYCYHVAGVVGVMTAIILGVRDRPTLERASDLGIGFQLTNIARDVVDDARRGRIYLPGEWLAEADLAPDALHRHERRGDLFRVVDRLLAVSSAYYQSASVGIARLPLRSAWAVATARRVYRGIGHEVRRRGSASWNERIVTRPRQKIAAGLLATLDAVALTMRTPVTARSRDGLWTPEALKA